MIGCLCSALNTLHILPGQSKRQRLRAWSPNSKLKSPAPHTPSRCSSSVNMICKIYKFIQRRRKPKPKLKLKPKPKPKPRRWRRPRLSSGPHVCFINASLESGCDSRTPEHIYPVLSALAKNVHDSLEVCDKTFGLGISVARTLAVVAELKLHFGLGFSRF